MTTGIVTFDEAAFLARFPMFSAWATANPGQLQERFNEVTAIYINNGPMARVLDVTERSYLINYAIAHVLTVEGALADPTTTDASAAAGRVGRVSSASEGTVSAQLDMGAVPGTAAWWMQTQFGAAYWNATAKYRTVRYARPPSMCYGVLRVRR